MAGVVAVHGLPPAILRVVHAMEHIEAAPTQCLHKFTLFGPGITTGTTGTAVVEQEQSPQHIHGDVGHDVLE